MKSLYLFITALLLASCGTSTQPTETTTGVLAGRLRLFDHNGTPLASSAGTVITAVNKGLTATTNDSGYWWMSKVPAGIYHLTATHHGFQPTEWAPLQFVGADTLVVDTLTAFVRPYLAKVVIDSTYMEGNQLTVRAKPIILDTGKVYSIPVELFASVDSSELASSWTKLGALSTEVQSPPYILHVPYFYTRPSGTRIYYMVVLGASEDPDIPGEYDQIRSIAHTPIQSYLQP